MQNVNKLIIKQEEDFGKIKELWKKLEIGKEMTFFQSYEWSILLYRQWGNSIFERRTSDIVIYYNKKIIAPFIIKRIGMSYKGIGLKRGIYFLGTGSYSDYMNFVYDQISEKEIYEFMNYVVNDNPQFMFYMFYINESNKLCTLIDSSKKISSDIAVTISTKISAEEYCKLLSKSTRQNLRTALNRMNKDNLSYKIDMIDGILPEELAEELIIMHRKRVKSKNNKEPKKNLYTLLLKAQVDYKEKNNNIIKCAMKTIEKGVTIIVYLNNKIVGYLYGFYDDKSIRIVHNCFNEEYAFYSPMFRGTYDFLRECCGNSIIDIVDFTRGNEEYKYKLGGKELKINSYKFNYKNWRRYEEK